MAINRHSAHIVDVQASNDLGNYFVIYCIVSAVFGIASIYILRYATQVNREKMHAHIEGKKYDLNISIFSTVDSYLFDGQKINIDKNRVDQERHVFN